MTIPTTTFRAGARAAAAAASALLLPLAHAVPAAAAPRTDLNVSLTPSSTAVCEDEDVTYRIAVRNESRQADSARLAFGMIDGITDAGPAPQPHDDARRLRAGQYDVQCRFDDVAPGVEIVVIATYR